MCSSSRGSKSATLATLTYTKPQHVTLSVCDRISNIAVGQVYPALQHIAFHKHAIFCHNIYSNLVQQFLQQGALQC